ncbi:MAG TPA: hypothetical protein VGH30_12905, partial [Jatrophihabitantaceae bacterium]
PGGASVSSRTSSLREGHGAMLVGRLAAVIALLSGTMITASAEASPGPGTFTKITTPSTTKFFHFDASPGATTNHFTVSGKTSADVTSVDIDCLYTSSTGELSSTPLATAVAVSGGAFSTVVTVPNLIAQCRLRAVPTGTAITDYLGSYNGPLLYSWVTGIVRDSSHVAVGTAAGDEKSDGFGVYQDSDECDGVVLTATIAPPNMIVEGASAAECVAGPSSSNVTSSGTSTASSLQVDHHNAYWPPMVAGYLIGDRSLAVTQPALKATFHRSSNGDLAMTVSGLLMRCSVSDTYPPTSTSCPSLVSTGVKYQRVVTVVDSSHQVRIGDSFISTGGKHTVSAEYETVLPLPVTGSSGYRFPGQTGQFHAVTSDQKVTGLSSAAGTILERSDLNAFEGDKQAATTGITYSRAPANLRFMHSSGEPDGFAMPYTLKVPANGAAHLALVVSNAVTTADVKKLTAGAVGDFVAAPVITSPTNGATVHGHLTKVKGTVAPGANGLPVSVSVNGHHATTTASGSFTVSFNESFGKHTLTAVATDIAGSTDSSSIKVTNKT